MPALIRHPDSPELGLEAVTVRVSFQAAGLALEYRLRGDLEQLRLPSWTGVHRADQLWEHSCFELFAGQQGAAAYREFNFAPSGAWAVYAFSAYRKAEVVAEVLPPPDLHCERGPRHFALRLGLPLAVLPARMDRLGLSAVLESRAGEKAYWALAHPGAQPDFHHPHAFALACAG